MQAGYFAVMEDAAIGDAFAVGMCGRDRQSRENR